MRIEKKRGDAEQEEDCGRNVLQTEIIMRGASAFNHDIKHLRLPWRPALKTTILFLPFFNAAPIRSSLLHKDHHLLHPPTVNASPLVCVYVPSDNLTRRSSPCFLQDIQPVNGATMRPTLEIIATERDQEKKQGRSWALTLSRLQQRVGKRNENPFKGSVARTFVERIHFS